MSPRWLPVLLCCATSPFWRSPFWRNFSVLGDKMQYLRRDKKDEEDGKEFIFIFLSFLLEWNESNAKFSPVLGPQSNPFQNLDKSAVLQEVSLKLDHNYLILNKLRSFNYFWVVIYAWNFLTLNRLARSTKLRLIHENASIFSPRFCTSSIRLVHIKSKCLNFV